MSGRAMPQQRGYRVGVTVFKTAEDKYYRSVPCTTVYVTPLWRGFPSSIARQPRGCRSCRIPNHTSSESSRRDVSNAGLFGTGTFPAVEVSSMEIGPEGSDINRRVRYS